MFILRSVREEDLEALYELSQIQVFINLPSNLEVLKNQINKSQKAFKKPFKVLSKNYYIFVLEDTESNEILGTSMIHAKHGTRIDPHFSLKVGTENKYSESMHTGYIHKTLKLQFEHDGWSEIGGLILDPTYRGSKEKFGKQLSYIRFLYMGLNSSRFTDVIHTELMPPFDDKGNSPLWESIGRRFMHMDYDEADQKSRKNKEFIQSLFPAQTIYEALLPLEARRAIGEVGETTKPVKKMLENIGFEYMNEVDPFDGGPHYRARLQDISLIQDMKHSSILIGNVDRENSFDALISITHSKHSFFAFKARISLEKNKNKNRFVLDKSVALSLNIDMDTKATYIKI